jgi:hypothetical protein
MYIQNKYKKTVKCVEKKANQLGTLGLCEATGWQFPWVFCLTHVSQTGLGAGEGSNLEMTMDTEKKNPSKSLLYLGKRPWKGWPSS